MQLSAAAKSVATVLCNPMLSFSPQVVFGTQKPFPFLVRVRRARLRLDFDTRMRSCERSCCVPFAYLVLSRHVVSCLVLSRLVSSAGSGKAGSDVRHDRAAESSSKAQVIKTVLSSDCCSDWFMSATATANRVATGLYIGVWQRQYRVAAGDNAGAVHLQDDQPRRAQPQRPLLIKGHF